MPAINCDQFTKILDDKLNPLNSTISELKKSVNAWGDEFSRSCECVVRLIARDDEELKGWKKGFERWE